MHLTGAGTAQAKEKLSALGLGRSLVPLGQRASLGRGGRRDDKAGERVWESAPRAPRAILIAFELPPQNTAASSGIKLE